MSSCFGFSWIVMVYFAGKMLIAWSKFFFLLHDRCCCYLFVSFVMKDATQSCNSENKKSQQLSQVLNDHITFDKKDYKKTQCTSLSLPGPTQHTDK